ncbi:auxin response factor 18-like [Hibiscus syriacus]|uniref:Auxin response factor 18-like n=1 Tax=Hibiscus syriacus TaxID=106335 RepID=A0A6A2Z6P9_HIBSY|nr:auxin response factor 18-like [Hibiscus syriacus]
MATPAASSSTPSWRGWLSNISSNFITLPFVASLIFTCEINVILKTLVDEEELMNLLFSFLEPNRSHSALLAGYFSKVVCLMLQKTVPIMNYVQVHQDVFIQLVDLTGITFIMECPPVVHANAAETLCAITRNSPSALATKLSSPSFVARIFGHELEDSHSKSGLIHSLSVCISLLDPKGSAIVSPLMHSFRHQHMYMPRIPVNAETIYVMLPKLGNLLMLLNVSSDEKILPTTYGELRPPLGKDRVKIVEFIAVLLRNGNEAAEKELMSSGTIQRVLDLFFEYPYNNALHHHVESIILSCLESKNDSIVDHLLQESVIKLHGYAVSLTCSGQTANFTCCWKMCISGSSRMQAHLLFKLTTFVIIKVRLRISYVVCEWNEWQPNVLQECNAVENVYRWACGHPTAFQDRTRDSDEDDIHDRDYDVAALANNLTQAFNYKIYGNDDNEEVCSLLIMTIS